MADYEMEELAGFEWMQSRIPALDALVHFIPDGPRDAAIDSFAASHRSRWYAGNRNAASTIAAARRTPTPARTIPAAAIAVPTALALPTVDAT